MILLYAGDIYTPKVSDTARTSNLNVASGILQASPLRI